MILGLSSLLIVPLLGLLDAIIRPILDPESVNPNAGLLRGSGFASCVFSLIFAVLSLVTGMRATKNGERSWAVWAGMLAALLAGGFWVFMILGELLFSTGF
jgi:hypothetical protein